MSHTIFINYFYFNCMHHKMNALCKALQPTCELFMTMTILLIVSLENSFYVHYQRTVALDGEDITQDYYNRGLA